MTTRVGALGVVEKAAGTTSITLTLPAGAAVGDVAVAGGGCNIATIMGAQTGWTTILSKSSTADTLAPNGILCLRTIDATDVSNGFVTLNNVTSAVGNFGGVLLRGVTTTQDFTAVYLDKTGTANGNFDFPTQTTTQPGVTLVYMVSQATVASATMTPPSAPAAFTEDAERVTGRNMTMGDLIWGSSGATGTMTVVSGASTRGIGLMVALRSVAVVDVAPAARRINRQSVRRRAVSGDEFRGIYMAEVPARQSVPIRTFRRTARRLAPRVAGNFIAPPPAQPAAPALVPNRQRERVRLAAYARTRLEFVPIPATVVPPPAFVPGVQGRDRILRGWASRRTRSVAGFSVDVPLRPSARRMQRMSARRVRRVVEVVPTQIAAPVNPDLIHRPSQRRALRGWPRQTRRAQLVGSQDVLSQRAAARVVRARMSTRTRRVELVPTQAVVIVPAYVPSASQRRTVRGWLARRWRKAEVVPAPVTPTAPAYVPNATGRRTVRGWIARKTRRPEVVPPQAAPTAPAFVPQASRRRTAKMLTRRTRAPWAHVAGQPHPTPARPPTRRPRALQRPRTRATGPVPPQVAVVAPKLVGRASQRRTLRGWIRRPGRHYTPVQPGAFNLPARGDLDPHGLGDPTLHPGQPLRLHPSMPPTMRRGSKLATHSQSGGVDLR